MNPNNEPYDVTSEAHRAEILENIPVPKWSMSHLSAGSGYPTGSSGRGSWSQVGWAEWVARCRSTWRELGGRQSPLLLTRPIKRVFKRLLTLDFSFTATEEKGSGKPDRQLVSAKIAAQIYATSSGFSKWCKTRQSGRVSLKPRVSRAEWKAELTGQAIWEEFCENSGRRKGSRIVFLSPENVIV